jgi:predicted NUDIX family NTP pyrophosphohydrolase
MRSKPKESAGLLLFRERDARLEVLLVHPGGPLWAKKDDGAWSIPKGELTAGEDPVTAARREFTEELGAAVDGEFIPLGAVKQPGGKVIHAWAVRGDFDPARLKSNAFSMEWPPRSGKQQEFPEVDRAEWFGIETGRAKILKGQAAFLDQLRQRTNP